MLKRVDVISFQPLQNCSLRSGENWCIWESSYFVSALYTSRTPQLRLGYIAMPIRLAVLERCV
jgi:hypothetical protein